MNAGKKARHAASITNSTKIYGIMGGSINAGSRRSSIRTALNRATTQTSVPSTYNFYPRPSGPNKSKNLSRNAYMFMVNKNMLSVNPTGSGGIWGIQPRAQFGGGRRNF